MPRTSIVTRTSLDHGRILPSAGSIVTKLSPVRVSFLRVAGSASIMAGDGVNSQLQLSAQWL